VLPRLICITRISRIASCNHLAAILFGTSLGSWKVSSLAGAALEGLSEEEKLNLCVLC